MEKLKKCVFFCYCALAQRSLVSFLSTVSKDLSSKTTGQISFRFHMEPPGNTKKEILYIWSRSHDHDGRQAHIW